jgi:hypothetical protein
VFVTPSMPRKSLMLMLLLDPKCGLWLSCEERLYVLSCNIPRRIQGRHPPRSGASTPPPPLASLVCNKGQGAETRKK